MRIEFSPAAQRALSLALRYAAALPPEAVPSALRMCLLRALTNEREGVAVNLLTAIGTGLDHILPDWTPAEQEADESPEWMAIRQAARSLATQHGANEVGSDHLLLAALEDNAIRLLLITAGTRVDELQAKVQAVPAIHLDEPIDLNGPSEGMEIARIVDANANRAREALRVLEEYARFVLDDAVLSRELKEMRHELASILGQIDLPIAARDTVGDVGTEIRTETEGRRTHLRGVVAANAKRLQEALRSLEEYLKIEHDYAARTAERLRYQSYTLERALLVRHDRLLDARLYVLVSGEGCKKLLDWTIQEAVAGGADIIQLREKTLNDRELLARARDVRRLTRQTGALFIVNDRPDIARLCAADGVHLGQDDLSVHEARRIVGPDALIGVSTHDMEQVRKAVLDGADYLGIGPTFPSATKDFAELAGIDFIKQACTATSLPTFALGGINVENVAQVVAAGARRIAVGHAICQAEEPRVAAEELRRAILIDHTHERIQ